jgi:hypothetical protein
VIPNFEALRTTVTSYGGVTPAIVKAPFASVTVAGSPVMTTGELAIGCSDALTTLPDTVMGPPVPGPELESLLHPGRSNRRVTSETTSAASSATLMRCIAGLIAGEGKPTTISWSGGM